MPPDTADGRVLELYVRSIGDGGAAAPAYADRVDSLERTGDVAHATVLVWGAEVGLSSTAFRTRVGKHILDRVAAFRAWAQDRGGTMGPFFESRTVTGTVTGEACTSIRLPVACLAEYEDGDLVHVAPHRRDGTVCSVDERLRALESATTEGGPVARPVEN